MHRVAFLVVGGFVVCVGLVLLGNDEEIIPRPDRVMPKVRSNLRGVGFKDLLRGRGPLIHDLPRRHGRHHRDRGGFPRNAPLLRKRFPARVFLIFRKAPAELSRMA
jgi:hypothetical protein